MHEVNWTEASRRCGMGPHYAGKEHIQTSSVSTVNNAL
jgi:hypothetical protein